MPSMSTSIWSAYQKAKKIGSILISFFLMFLKEKIKIV